MTRVRTAERLAASAALIALMIGAAPALAAPAAVKVKVGDHGDFSRIALVGTGGRPEVTVDRCTLTARMPQPVDWPVDTLRRFWSKRLSDYRIGDDGKTMTVTIPCGADARVKAERKVVFVDVRDAPASEPVAAAVPATPPQPVAIAEPKRLRLDLLDFSLASPAQAAELPPIPTAPASANVKRPLPLLAVIPGTKPSPPADPAPPARQDTAPAEQIAAVPAPPSPVPPPAPLPAAEIAIATPAPPPPAPPPPPAAPPVPPPQVAAAASGVAPASGMAAAVKDGFEKATRSLTPPMSTPRPLPAKNEPPPLPSFDLNTWGAGNHAERRAELERAVSENVGAARVGALLDMARFALAHALREEGRGAIDVARSMAPNPDQTWQLHVLEDAFRALDRSGDPDNSVFVQERAQPDADQVVWRTATLAPSRWGLARAGLSDALHRLQTYPTDLRSRLLTLLADAAAPSDPDSLNAILTGMVTNDNREMTDGRVDYFRGRLAELRHDSDTALDRYRDASTHPGLYGQRAKVRSIELMLSAGRTAEPDAIAKLEELRFAWRGDDVEADALADLGLLYTRAGRVDEALDVFGLLERRFGPTDRGRDALTAGRSLLTAVIDGLAQRPEGALTALAIRVRHQRAIALLDDDKATLHRQIAGILSANGYSTEAIRILGDLTQTHSGPTQATIGLDLARALIAAGRADEVSAVLDRTGAGDSDPDRAYERTVLRAEAATENGDYLAANRALRGLDAPRALMLTGRIAARAGEWDATEKAYGDALAAGIALSPDDAGLALLAASRNGHAAAMIAKVGDTLRGTRWQGLAETLVEPAPPSGPWSNNAIKSRLAATDAIIALARQWGVGGDP